MAVEVSSVSFSYGKRRILDDVSFSLDRSSLTAFLGRNGAGKSTLLRIMMGFLRPEKGHVAIDGDDIRQMKASERARRISYIPQSSMMAYPSCTVKEAVLMGRAPSLPLLASPGRTDMEMADEVLERLGISHLGERSMTAISGGERQLALIARALVQDASIILLDEPTSSLDYLNQLKVLETLSRLKEKGYTVLFTTHSPEQALMAADDVLLIDDDGRTEMTDKESIIATDRLSRLYGRRLCIREIDTGRNVRIACVPE